MTAFDERVQRVFQEVFDDEHLEINDGLSTRTLPLWDSFAQVKLIVGLEEEFDVKFSTHEVATLGSVRDLKLALREKGV